MVDYCVHGAYLRCYRVNRVEVYHNLHLVGDGDVAPQHIGAPDRVRDVLF